MSSAKAADSPSAALTAELLRRFGSERLPHFIEIYRIACCHGALDESGVQRGKGVSFNPRPARIAQILLNAIPESSEALITAAILSSARRPLSIDLPSHYASLHAALPLPQTDSNSGRQQQPPPEAIAILLAEMLDRVRHLHMQSAPKSEKIQSLEQAADLCNRYHDLDYTKTLIAKLRHAVERMQKLIIS